MASNWYELGGDELTWHKSLNSNGNDCGISEIGDGGRPEDIMLQKQPSIMLSQATLMLNKMCIILNSHVTEYVNDTIEKYQNESKLRVSFQYYPPFCL